ncbi:DUF6941 family protein [Nocardia salmonicida]|uniref:DUF6941 family protein n=1 Tax=Nocardia salmonicida TaxID=53431 RepID=UPI0036435D5C
MKFTTLMLADHANVAEGLLYINGGCVNFITRSEFPAPLGAMLAAAISVPVESFGHPMDFKLTMTAVGEEEPIVQIGGQFTADVKDDAEKLPFANSFVVDLRAAPIPAEGNYVITASVGDATDQIYLTARLIQPEDAP